VQELLGEQGRRWRELVADAPIIVRVHQEDLGRIVDDGRLRTQHETGTSSAALDSAWRSHVEQELFGQAQPPIYGYLLGSVGAGRTNAPVRHYGSALLVMSQQVRARTSVLAYDTLGGYSQWSEAGEAPHGCPELIGNVTHRSLVRPLPEGESLREVASSHPRPFPFGYCEAQIHEGVELEDIERIVFERPIPDQLQRKLEAAGIAWSVQPDVERVGLAPVFASLDQVAEHEAGGHEAQEPQLGM
jgi:hypothetical protein